MRWYESYQLGHGHIPLSNLYESLMSLAWTTVILYLIVEYRYKSKALGVFIFPWSPLPWPTPRSLPTFRMRSSRWFRLCKATGSRIT